MVEAFQLFREAVRLERMLGEPHLHIRATLAIVELPAELRAGAAHVVFDKSPRGIQVFHAGTAREAQDRGEREFLLHVHDNAMIPNGYVDMIEEAQVPNASFKFGELRVRKPSWHWSRK